MGTRELARLVSFHGSEIERSTREESDWTDELCFARFDIVDLDAREGGDELYLSSVTPDGRPVIERLTFPPKPGRLVARAVDRTPRRGTPSGPFEFVVEVTEGESAPASSAAGRALDATRDVLWEGEAPGVFDSVHADPEGRFLLLFRRSDRTLYELDLTAPDPSPVAVLSPREQPALERVDQFYALDHDRLGRVYRMGPSRGCIVNGDDAVVFVIDRENDGRIDESRALTQADLLDADRGDGGFRYLWSR